MQPKQYVKPLKAIDRPIKEPRNTIHVVQPSAADRIQRSHNSESCGPNNVDERSPSGVYLAVLSPLILTADLVLLLRGEVILDVERLSDLVGALALDHVGDGLAADIKQRLDI